MRRYPEGTKEYEKLHTLKPVFVVDECHRAVSPLAQHLINQYFARPLWYGFTGTPIFSEDAKDSPGDLPATTEEQYGKCPQQVHHQRSPARRRRPWAFRSNTTIPST